MDTFKKEDWLEPKYFINKVLTPKEEYINPAEEPVRQWMIAHLINNYNVPLEQMDIEVIEKVTDIRKSEHRRPIKRPDIEIFDDRFSNQVVFIMVELLAPEYSEDSSVWNEHYDRLNQYMSLSNSARYAILSNGNITKFYRRDLEYPRALEPISDLPKYESAREAAKNRKFTVIYNEKFPNNIKTHLRVLTREEFKNILGDTRGGIHGLLRSNEGRNPQEAVEDMTKILFAKIFDEIETVKLAKEKKENRAFVFSVGTKTDPERLLSQVRMTFEAAKEWEKKILEKYGRFDNSRRIFDPNSQITLRANTVYRIVEKIQAFSFQNSPPSLKGSIFEDFLGRTFRDDLGQFFTPTEVIDIIVRILEPEVDDLIGDPCCGPARFHTHTLNYIAEKNKIDIENPENEDFLKFRNNNLFGADNAENILHIAKVNCFLNEAPFIDLRKIDSLDPLTSIVDYENGKVRKEGFVEKGLTKVMTNPPFGMKINDPRKTKEFDIITTMRGKADSQILFIERCLTYLKDNGKLGIVIPESILDNKSNAGIRQWIYIHSQITAVISLPLETFKPYGTGVKTAILFLKKLSNEEKKKKIEEIEKKSSQKTLQSFINPKNDKASNNHNVFMGFVNNIGYDNTGRPVEGSDVDDIIKAYLKFKEKGKIDSVYGKHYMIPEIKLCNNRFDVKYYEYFPIDEKRFPETCYFSECIYVIEEKVNPRIDLIGEEVPYVSIEGLENDSFYIDEPEFLKPSEEIKNQVKKFRGGDILIARLGPSFNNKKSVAVSQDIDTCYGSSEFLVLRPKSGVSTDFILWLVKSDMFIKQGLSKCTGATPSRYRLHNEYVTEIIVPKFSREEQLKFGKDYFEGRRLIQKKRKEIQSRMLNISPDF